MSIGKKISQIRREKHIKIAELSERSGVPVSTLKKVLSGATKDPQIDTIKAIARALDCTLEELDDETHAAMFSSEEKQLISDYRRLDLHSRRVVRAVIGTELERGQTETEKRSIQHNKPSGKRINFPYSMPEYAMPVSAGTGSFLDSDSYELLELRDQPPEGANFIVRVSGDSMEPTYHNGDKLFVKQQPEIEAGEIGIFMVNGDVFVKELANDGLISHNADYEKIEFREYDNIRCYGKVIGTVDQ